MRSIKRTTVRIRTETLTQLRRLKVVDIHPPTQGTNEATKDLRALRVEELLMQLQPKVKKETI